MARGQDHVFMARAIRLAKKGCFTTDPNPNVGCVLVRDNQVIGEGWHAWSGQAHAEVEALKHTADAKGATAYVTLEPCNHQGKTPPCCEALINAGVKRVVVAMQDPNPIVAGSGMERLRDAGIEVESGLLEVDALKLNRGFLKRMNTGRPLVISKMAMSLDGRTAMASGESKWITSAAARHDVHRLRAASSAVLTGINTILADDPLLNARLENTEVKQPMRVVLDSELKMPTTARMTELPGRSLILSCSDNAEKKDALQQAGFEVYKLSADENNQVDLKEVFNFLGKQQINQVLVEAGPVLNGALLTDNQVDEWVVYMAPSIMSDKGRGLFTLPGLQSMEDKINLQIIDVRKTGLDIRLTFSVKV